MLYKKVIRITDLTLLLGVMFGIVSHGEQRIDNRKDATMLAMEGSKLSSKDAKNLEDKLKVKPNDLSARTRLLGYYHLKAFESDSGRKARQKHIIWVIQNQPESEIAGLPWAELDPVLDGELYYEAKKLWLKHVETNAKNTTILGNAANFFLLHDRDIAEDLLKKAQRFEPDNPEWPDRLGHLYGLGMMDKPSDARREAALKSLEQQENALRNITEEVERFYMLSDLAEAAFEAGQLEKAKTYATELLNKTTHYRSDWNYGNAVHHGNLIFGRLALRSGDLEKAKSYLIEAGKTPGSPQLNSFGPNMTLAKELLEKGEREVVIKYFELCANFWEMGKDRLKSWTSIVKGGQIPDFGGNLAY